MEKPNVYFMDARSESPDTSLINKTVTVFEAAGFEGCRHVLRAVFVASILIP